MSDHLFTTKSGIAQVFAVLIYQGDACPKCGHGTKRTSKRFAKCPACGLMKIERRQLPERQREQPANSTQPQRALAPPCGVPATTAARQPKPHPRKRRAF